MSSSEGLVEKLGSAEVEQTRLRYELRALLIRFLKLGDINTREKLLTQEDVDKIRSIVEDLEINARKVGAEAK